MARALVDRIGSFTAVPNAFIDGAAVSSDAFRVFVYLRRCVNTTTDGETAWPAYGTIMAACRLGHRRKLAAALKELSDSGWIERYRRFGNSTVYVLKMPDPAPETPAAVVPAGGTIVVPAGGTIVVPPAGTLTRLNEQDVKEQELERAPQKRRVSGFAALITAHDDPRVSAYLSTVKPEITESYAELIMDRVAPDKVAIWQSVLELWATNEYRTTNFTGMLERYDTSVNAARIRAKVVAKPPTAPPSGRSSILPQVQDLNGSDLDAARARAREQRAARQKLKNS